jgi:hypothetical protein
MHSAVGHCKCRSTPAWYLLLVCTPIAPQVLPSSSSPSTPPVQGCFPPACLHVCQHSSTCRLHAGQLLGSGWYTAHMRPVFAAHQPCAVPGTGLCLAELQLKQGLLDEVHVCAWRTGKGGNKAGCNFDTCWSESQCMLCREAWRALRKCHLSVAIVVLTGSGSDA